MCTSMDRWLDVRSCSQQFDLNVIEITEIKSTKLWIICDIININVLTDDKWAAETLGGSGFVL